MEFRDVGRQAQFSAILRLFAASPRERITVAELLDGFGDRSFGAALLLLALPNMVPLPPGASTLFGLPMLLISGQMALGRQTIWLPESVRRRSIPTTLFSRIVHVTRPRAERVLQPRLPIMFAPAPLHLVGVACVVLAIVIALPIPVVNFLSGLAVSIFALGLLRRDGYAILAGWLATSVSLATTVLVSGAVWIVAETTLKWLANAF